MKRLVLFSTIFGLLLVSEPGAIANSEKEETHIGEGSLQNIGQNSGYGNLDNNAGLHAPALPPLGLPSGGLPALPALPSLPSGLSLPTGLPAGLPGLPTGLPGLPTLPLSAPLVLQAPLGLPVL